MNEEEAKKIIDNMSEQELNDFIFFALKEVEKENQKLKTELEKKDKIIDEMTEYLASIDFDEHCVEVPGICIGCPKEDDLDGYMQCIKQYFERKVENRN